MTTHLSAALSAVDHLLSGVERVLIVTDFDGTLCPIVDSPSETRLAPAMSDILRRMAASPRMALAVISGRALDDLAPRLPAAIVAGNHGLEMRGEDIAFEHPAARDLRSQLGRACVALESAVALWPGAWVENKGLSASVHYRRVNERSQQAVVFAARRTMSPFCPAFSMRAGHKALEIRPRIPWNKGSALKYIKVKTGISDACLCLADDRTDESMFLANRNGLNIHVGPSSKSGVGLSVADSNEVALVLSHALDLVELRWDLRARLAQEASVCI